MVGPRPYLVQLAPPLIGVIVTLALKRQFFYINICCFITIVLSGQDWYHSITQLRKPLLDERISEITYTPIVSNFVAMATGVNSQTPTTPTRCKDLDDISYTNWVIGLVYFISNFVAMTTGVGRGGICLTAFNSPTLKTLCCVQESRRYLPQKPSYYLFCFKFSLPWQQGLVVVEFVCRRSIAQPPKPSAQTSRWYFPYKLSYGPFCFKFRCHGNQGLSF